MHLQVLKKNISKIFMVIHYILANHAFMPFLVVVLEKQLCMVLMSMIVLVQDLEGKRISNTILYLDSSQKVNSLIWISIHFSTYLHAMAIAKTKIAQYAWRAVPV